MEKEKNNKDRAITVYQIIKYFINKIFFVYTKDYEYIRKRYTNGYYYKETKEW